MLLGVSGPGLRGTAAIPASLPQHRSTFLRHLGTQDAERPAISLAACCNQFRGDSVGPKSTTGLGLGKNVKSILPFALRVWRVRRRPAEKNRGCLLVCLHLDQMFRRTEFDAVFSKLLQKLSLMLIGLRLKRRESFRRHQSLAQAGGKNASCGPPAYAPQTKWPPSRPSPAGAPWNLPDPPSIAASLAKQRLSPPEDPCHTGTHAICRLSLAQTFHVPKQLLASLLTIWPHCKPPLRKERLEPCSGRNGLAFWCALLATA